MKEKSTTKVKITVLLFLLVLYGIINTTSQARGEELLLTPDQAFPDPATLSDIDLFIQEPLSRGDLPLIAPDYVIEVFDNEWAGSSMGLVYDPGLDTLRYVHENQPSSHDPTIYDVDYAPPHTVVNSFALSAVNSGWPSQINDRTGAGYDFIQDTYFLTDHNGDLSYADDNIIEVDASGKILNAWEMDDQVGSNDSSDGSKIDKILDIAVVPGRPTRYFVTASYDGPIVYEIGLIKTGTLWTPNSWYTIATYPLPELSENLGIDWDAEHEVLFHSDWDSTTILITDLAMNPITEVFATFDCPGAKGYNTGITYIEGSDPTEVWVTDNTSDQTTRCETPFSKEVFPPSWEKSVNELPWQPDISVTVETGDTISVEDVLTPAVGNPDGFTLIEEWNPEELALMYWIIEPSDYAQYATNPSPGRWFLEVPPNFDFGPVSIEKWYAIQPCNWPETILWENLYAGMAVLSKPIVMVKLQPLIDINSYFDMIVHSGDVAEFQLTYGNAGGFESQAFIRAVFPPEAPFHASDPPPDEVDSSGLWANWDLGSLGPNDSGSIAVDVKIAPDLPLLITMEIGAGIFDHDDELDDETFIFFRTSHLNYLSLVLRD